MIGLPVLAQSPHTHRHGFGDAQKWAKIFDDPERDAWQKPHEVIQALALKPDAVVADIGAGTGYFAVRLAHMVPRGRVYAVDTESAMVKHVAERAKRAGLPNVMAVQGTATDPRLPEKADLILFVDVYHHVENRERYFSQLAAALKPGGRVAVVDFRMDSPHGPPKAARVEPQSVTAELARAGYRLSQEHAFLPYQYFLVFEPAKDAVRGFTPMQGMHAGMHGGGPGAHRPMHGAVMMLTRQDEGSSRDMGLVHELLMNHRGIRREVTLLPDGIRTVTESDDPGVARAIQAHVASMSQRLESGREFNIFSTTLPVLFENRDKIQSAVELTQTGAIVTRTSNDAKVVAALQAHAAEVTELVQQGMAAMRRGMMARMAADRGAAEARTPPPR